MTVESYLVTVETELKDDAVAAWNAAKTLAQYVEGAAVSDVQAALPNLISDLIKLIEQIGSYAVSALIKSLSPGATVTVPTVQSSGTQVAS